MERESCAEGCGVGWEDSFRRGGGAGLKDDVGRQVGREGGDGVMRVRARE